MHTGQHPVLDPLPDGLLVDDALLLDEVLAAVPARGVAVEGNDAGAVILLHPLVPGGELPALELQTKVRNDFIITDKAPTRAFS